MPEAAARAASAAPAHLDEDRARLVTLLQAFETAAPASPNWSDDDSAWATRLALNDTPAGASANDYLAHRAAHAWQRLGPREPAAAAWLARRLWRARWVGIAVVLGLLLGLLADSIGSGQRINLLAPPLWAVLAWNAIVYAALLGHALARLMRRPSGPGAVTRLAQRALLLGRALPGAGTLRAKAGASAAALQSFAALWAQRSAALSAARATTLLHAAAAALALGLIAGLYLRGLVLDYRAGWESTFLGAGAAHAIVATLLAPASMLSGIVLPDAAGFEALRVAHGAPATAPAAPWIHLFALTLALAVVLPRSALALAAALRAHWLARRIKLPADDAYLQRLARAQRRDVAHAVALPYASTPDAQAALGLRALLAPVLGDSLQLRIAPTVAHGSEDEAPLAGLLGADTTLALACFDLTATPERENQGRFARRVAQAAPAGAATVVLVDEAAFARRFGAASARRSQRREAWHAFAQALGTTPVFADLGAPEIDAAGRALQQALRQPVARKDAS
ncbi:MAG TPA: DUF2868 domain-containing protein [Burkholderiaceae bacterium]|nr:DUF2868 domain-containing protein [Burkholderiaceae bacterium]